MDRRARKVWIADDSRLERQQTAAVLEEHYQVATFTDGTEVVERLGAGQSPDVLIVDWHMTAMHGLDVITFARAQSAFRDIGIIVLTASHEVATVSSAMSAGADDFVKKPVDPVELSARVARLIARAEARERMLASAERRLADEQQLRLIEEASTAAAQRNEERMRLIVDATGVGTWELDLRTNHVVADEQMQVLAGLDPGAPFSVDGSIERIHPDDRDSVRSGLAAALAGRNGGRYAVDHRSRSRSGEYRVIEGRGRVYFDDAGRPVRFLGTGRDITERKRSEQSREDLLNALSSQPSLQVCVLRGPNLVFEMTNQVFRSLWKGRELVGRPLTEAIPEARAQGFDAILRRVLETGLTETSREMEVLTDTRGDGSLQSGFFSYVFQPIIGADGIVDRVLVLATDVTDVVHAREEKDRFARQEKERADFEQQLIGIVSHDLRTPLSAILLGAGMLKRAALDDRLAKTIGRVQSSAERATRMVNDLLDFTQARLGGGIRIEVRALDLHAFVQQAIEEVRESLPDRSIALTSDGDGAGFWDADRLAQIVTNLVSNAVKYGTPGSPVRVHTAGAGNSVVLSVHNVGAPIPSESVGRIFEPLQRGAPDSDRAARSVGLGLYIVKSIVTAHRGTIEVHSAHADGTTFTVRLPRRARSG